MKMTYCQVPSCIFSKEYINLSSADKTALVLLLNRHRLSERTSYVDANGVFVLFPVAELALLLSVSRRTASGTLAALVRCGLITTVRTATGNRIYLTEKALNYTAFEQYPHFLLAEKLDTLSLIGKLVFVKLYNRCLQNRDDPTICELAEDLGVSRSTIRKAYDELLKHDLIYFVRTKNNSFAVTLNLENAPNFKPRLYIIPPRAKTLQPKARKHAAKKPAVKALANVEAEQTPTQSHVQNFDNLPYIYKNTKTYKSDRRAGVLFERPREHFDFYEEVKKGKSLLPCEQVAYKAELTLRKKQTVEKIREDLIDLMLKTMEIGDYVPIYSGGVDQTHKQTNEHFITLRPEDFTQMAEAIFHCAKPIEHKKAYYLSVLLNYGKEKPNARTA